MDDLVLLQAIVPDDVERGTQRVRLLAKAAVAAQSITRNRRSAAFG